MRVRCAASWAASLILLGIAACQVPGAPKWNVDVYFPIKYPYVPWSQYAPGGFIPTTTVSFQTPPDSQMVSSATQQVLSQDIDTLKADVILVNSANATGTITISIAAAQANLFSANPSLAVTATLPIRVTAGDTAHYTVSTTLFQQAQKLFTETKATVKSGGATPTPVSAKDSLGISVDLTANVKFSK
jgi:hypothetical protein